MQKTSFKFFCLSTEKFRWGTLRCYRKFRVSKNFMRRKGYHYFPLKVFCLTVPKKFVGEPFCFEKILVSKIFKHRRGGGHHGFVESFVSQDRNKKLGKGTHLFSIKFLVWKKIMDKEEGGITVFRRNFFVSQCRKISRGTFQCSRNFGVSKTFIHNRGVSRFSVENS